MWELVNFNKSYRKYMVGAEVDKVYPVRLRKLRGQAWPSSIFRLKNVKKFFCFIFFNSKE